MKKGLLISLLIIALMATFASATTVSSRDDIHSDVKKAKADAEKQEILENNPELRSVNYTTYTTPPSNRDQVLLGNTWYGMQRNGSLNHLTAAMPGETDDHKYAIWMYWPTANATTRSIRYQYYDPTIGSWYDPADEIVVNNGYHGYASLDVTSDGRAVVAHHQANLSWVGLEGEPAIGAFTNSTVDDGSYVANQVIWPIVTVGHNDYAYVISSNAEPTGEQQHYFSKATGPAPGYWSGYNFDDWTIIPGTEPVIDLDGVLTELIWLNKSMDASLTSGKVMMSMTYYNTALVEDGMYEQVYYLSNDYGATWDGPNFITNNSVPLEPGGPTHLPGLHELTTWDDTDGDYWFEGRPAWWGSHVHIDHNDVAHVVWETTQIYWEPVGDGTYYFSSSYSSALCHWDDASNEITYILTDYANPIGYDTFYPEDGDNFTQFDRLGKKMSTMGHPTMGEDDEGNLFVLFHHFTDGDSAVNGVYNGELMVIASEDGGQTWGTSLGVGVPMNITNTPDPGCALGTCENERYATIAEKVTDRIHISYQVDTEPGQAIQDQGGFTSNPVYYQSVMVDDILPIPMDDDVAFNVDMSIQECEFNFDPETDMVVVRGSFNAWGGNGTQCTDDNGDGVYTAHAALDLFTVGTVEYKFVIVTAAGDQWEGVDNRTFEFTGSGVNLDTVYFNNDDVCDPVAPFDVRFVVDMNVQLVNGNFDPEGGDVVGPVGGANELNNWSGGNPVAMGEIPGQPGKYGVIVRFEAYPLGSTTNFKYIIANDGANKFWESSPDRPLTITGDDMIDNNGDGVYDFDYVHEDPDCAFFSCVSWADVLPIDVTVTFEVDITSAYKYLTMNPDSCLGDVQFPDYQICDVEDIMDVAVNGSFAGWWPWSTPDAPTVPPQYVMTSDNDTLWTVDVLFTAGQAKTFEYKFGINGADNEAGFAQNHVANLVGDSPTETLWVCFGEQRTDIPDWPNCDPMAIEDDEEISVIAANRLYQNHPNPFNPSTTIAFDLAARSEVNIAIYNVTGQVIRHYDLGVQNAGPHSVVWDAKDNNGQGVVSGVYFYRLQTNEGQQTKKMMLLK